ncbi:MULTISPECIES: hypothetical protein [Bradyrhizobium]|uniref:Uncharacterized protein n=1 Tax=Bradyrhizobium nanningense TaxID=1325118 RepID=A0A4Q0S2T5_9BRAD|nr:MULTISPECIES: hypothetical protein [Bradyrhizobium]RXH23081.1 hypothetical protein XH84_34355 [Bradyrhizobium nanningense]RXH27123.1 hypothetical protein XH99_16975 [Bradyrhizobium nanningense]TQF30959.1 hypothetical protein UNPA324_16075 [Bradyrhizobium sp. UNPA324]
MMRSIAVPLTVLVGLVCASASAQVGASPEIFTGMHRNESIVGRPETATITDGKSFIQLTEEQYRAGNYRPAYETLPTRIVRRLPVRKDSKE